MIIRREYRDDIPAIHAINRAAFPQGSEADLVDQLRTNGAVTLSLVALNGKELIAHLLFTEVEIRSAQQHLTAVAIAPMAVLPAFQNQGIGALLVKTGLDEIKAFGYPAVFVLGHPNYYPRFGFLPASHWNIQCEYDDIPEEAFMAIVWNEQSLPRDATVSFRPEFFSAMN